MKVAAVTLASLTLATTTFDPHSHRDHHRVVGHGQIRFDGAGPERWALRYRREHRLAATLKKQLRRQRHLILANSSVSEAIELAAATYGDGETLWRRARCESGLNRYARNLSSAASGLFQFLPSTWRSTPYARFSIFSPYANALAAGWMGAHGRGNEWSCR